jgi:ATP-dependent DNA helicase RecG
LLGLDEAAGFLPVGLPDRRRLEAALASKARQALDPPVTLDIDEGVVDGEPVMVAVVPELAVSQKPCRVAGGRHRGVWVRAWDGDYRASDVEVQGPWPTEGSHGSTLSPHLVRPWLTTYERTR